MRIKMSKTRLGCKYRGPVYWHDGQTMDASNYRTSVFANWWQIDVRRNGVWEPSTCMGFRTLKQAKEWIAKESA